MPINKQRANPNNQEVSKEGKVRIKVESFIGITLGHLRRSGNITRNELSQKTGLSESNLLSYEKGALIPSVSAVYKIAEILNFDAVEFITLSKIVTQGVNEVLIDEDILLE